MESKIKLLAQEITNAHFQSLVQTHVKELDFNEDEQHLVIFVDNAGPLHELESKDGDHYLNNALEAVYGEDITYEIKMHGQEGSERENAVPRSINQ